MMANEIREDQNVQIGLYILKTVSYVSNESTNKDSETTIANYEKEGCLLMPFNSSLEIHPLLS